MVICKLQKRIKDKVQNLKKNPKEILRSPLFYLLCILLFALFLRLYFFVGMGFYDDPTYLNTAYKIYTGVEHIPNPNFWELRIGVYYPIAFFWNLFGINELSSSLFFILCSLGSITVAYFIAKEFFSEKIALFSAFLLSIFPLNILYSTQIGPDIPFQFLTGLSVLFFIYHEKNKSHSYIYALLCGVFIGLAYTMKSLILLLIPLFIAYFIIKMFRENKCREIFNIKNGYRFALMAVLFLIVYSLFIHNMIFVLLLIFSFIFILIMQERGFKSILKKKETRYLFIILGFLLIFSVHLVHFYNVSGEWFFVENSRGYVFGHGLNDNDDYYWYPTEMFSLESDIIKDLDFIPDDFSAKGGYFENIHDPPMFGFMYFFVVIGSLWFVFRRNYDKFFLILWWFGFFFFFEFFLQFYCTSCVDYCVSPRVPRFLSAFTIPAVILAAGLLYVDIPKFIKSFKKVRISKKILSIIKVIAILFLFSTSIVFVSQSSTFIRNGIGDIRETADFLQTQPPKRIYAAHGLFRHKSQFFFEYDEEYTDNIRYFNRDEIDLSDEYFNSGEFISDAYVVLESTPYWLGFNRTKGFLPDFCKNPPESWTLLKTIDLPNYGLFNEFNPRIYYVPAD